MEADDSAINVPAIAAAHVIKRYIAQAPDEITLEVNVALARLYWYLPSVPDKSWQITDLFLKLQNIEYCDNTVRVRNIDLRNFYL